MSLDCNTCGYPAIRGATGASRNGTRYSLAPIRLVYGANAAEICDATRKAANTAGTLTSLRN